MPELCALRRQKNGTPGERPVKQRPLAKGKHAAAAKAKARPKAAAKVKLERPKSQPPPTQGGWWVHKAFKDHKGPKQLAWIDYTKSDEYRYTWAQRKWKYWPGQAPAHAGKGAERGGASG